MDLIQLISIFFNFNPVFRIRIRIRGSEAFWLDPDPDPLFHGSRWIQVTSDTFIEFLTKFWVFYFFEAWKSVKRFKCYDFLHGIQIFLSKKCIFFHFLKKSTQLWRLITFEPLDGFSNFKKVKHSKFWALSIKITWIRIGSGSAKRPGSGSAPKKSDPETLLTIIPLPEEWFIKIFNVVTTVIHFLNSDYTVIQSRLFSVFLRNMTLDVSYLFGFVLTDDTNKELFTIFCFCSYVRVLGLLLLRITSFVVVVIH